MPADLAGIHIPFLRDDEIRARTDRFRMQHWGEKIPVDVELIAEKNLKLLMIPIADLRYRAHAEAYLSSDLKEIVYDPSTPEVRIRFSVAHEIGHLVLHSDLIKKLRPGS